MSARPGRAVGLALALATLGLAGEERGERIVGTVCAAVSAVAPAREVSVLFGVILGRRLLNEEGLARRLVAAGAIVIGIIAVALDPGDKLVGVAITDGSKDILLFTTGGKAIRFIEDEVRPMGREAAGVRGVKLSEDQRVNALIVADQGYILTASENGFGKLTPLEDFPTHGRGGQGVIALQVTYRNGRMIGALQVSLDDEIMLMSQSGALVRTPVKDISVVGRTPITGNRNTHSTLVPIASTMPETLPFSPLITEEIVITVITPITIPRTVRNERKGLRRRTSTASAAASLS